MSWPKKKWVLLFVPLFLIEPLLDFLRNANQALWQGMREAIGFLEANPLVTILLIIIVLMMITNKE